MTRAISYVCYTNKTARQASEQQGQMAVLQYVQCNYGVLDSKGTLSSEVHTSSSNHWYDRESAGQWRIRIRK